MKPTNLINKKENTPLTRGNGGIKGEDECPTKKQPAKA
jgi:hypothetical protein